MLPVDEDMEELRHLHIARRNTKWYNHFERQFGSLCEVKYILTMSPKNYAPRLLSKKNETCLKKRLQ